MDFPKTSEEVKQELVWGQIQIRDEAWEKKAAERCNKVLKKKTNLTCCLIRYDEGGWGMRRDDSCLEPDRTSVPWANKEVSRNWFLGKFNFRNFKFEVLPGHPNLIPLLNLSLLRITSKSIPLSESPAVNQSPI